MMKNMYVLAWFLLAMVFSVSVLTGTLTPAALVVYSLIALGLVYWLAWWSITANSREI